MKEQIDYLQDEKNDNRELLGENRQSSQQKKTSLIEDHGDFDDALANAEKDYKIYPYRHVVAILYLISCLAISLQQNTFAPQGVQLQNIYGVPGIEITMTSLIHMILHPPLSFPANYIVDKYGIKTGILIATVFCIIGSWIRCLVNTNGGSFYWCLIGQVFVGIANPFVINSMNKISSTWFYPADRAGVTSFLSFFSTITGLLGLLMPGIWFSGFNFNGLTPSEDPNSPWQQRIQEGKEKQFSLNLVQAIMITAFMFPNIFFFREKPPTPPCFTIQVENEEFKVALKQLTKDKNYLIQCITFSIYYGSFTILAVILTYILDPFNLGDSLNSAILASLPIVSGIIGCILSSKYLKKTQKYKKTLIICQIGSILALALFMCLLPTQLLGLVIPPVFLVGFFIIPLIPTMLEFSCETNFPIGEATTTGFLFAVSHIFGGLLGLGMTALVSPTGGESQKEMQIRSVSSIGGICLFFILSFILFRVVKENLKRLKAEKERKFDKDDNTCKNQNDLQKKKILNNEFYSDSQKEDNEFNETKNAYSGSEIEDI